MWRLQLYMASLLEKVSLVTILLGTDLVWAPLVPHFKLLYISIKAGDSFLSPIDYYTLKSIKGGDSTVLY